MDDLVDRLAREAVEYCERAEQLACRVCIVRAIQSALRERAAALHEWLPGVNILIVATECAGEHVPDIREATWQNKHFGESTHHSHLPALWAELVGSHNVKSGQVVVVSTENSAVIDCAPFPAADLARRLVRLTRGGFRRLTEDEAAMLVQAHEAGVESPSEILRTRGLW